jgi:quercetin dioxygenase-like cupin family protein
MFWWELTEDGLALPADFQGCVLFPRIILTCAVPLVPVAVLPWWYTEQGSVWEMESGRPTTFKLLSEQTSGAVSVFEEVVPMGGGTPLHIHHTSDEVIHLLAGELRIRLGTQVTTIAAGTWVFIPRGTPHAWKNLVREPARAAFVFCPADGAKCFEELRLLGLPISNIDPVHLDALCKRHGYQLVSFEWE